MDEKLYLTIGSKIFSQIIALFRHLVLQTKTQHTLSVLRFKCFAIGSWIVKNGRKKILKLSVA
ncbi:MAG: IS1380 family transposase, partial [Candidatus Scalindua sp.]